MVRPACALRADRYIKCRRIGERQFFLRRRRGQCGKILPRLRATSGFAGLLRARKPRREISVSRRGSQSLKAECAGRVVGPVVLIVDGAAPRSWAILVIQGLTTIIRITYAELQHFRNHSVLGFIRVRRVRRLLLAGRAEYSLHRLFVCSDFWILKVLQNVASRGRNRAVGRFQEIA